MTCFNGLQIFDENSSGGAIKSEIASNQKLAELIHKSIVRKFEKWEVYSPFKNSIWGTDLVNTQLISKYNKGFCCILFDTCNPRRECRWNFW